MTFEDTIQAIRDERERQILRWESDAFDYPGKPWLAILVEEVGEVARQVLLDSESPGGTADPLLKELIQVAAVASFWAAELKS